MTRVQSLLILLALSGCKPDLKVAASSLDFAADTASVTVRNSGKTAAGPFMVYVEINRPASPESARPESQHSVRVPGLASEAEWSTTVPFSGFSPRGGLDLGSLTSANLTVRADAKNEVAEGREDNNVSSETY
jgi:hypothetical protein